MSGIGDETLYCSSWGWRAVDGADDLPYMWRQWSVTWKGERKLLLLLPPETDSVQVLLMAGAIADQQGWE